MNLQGWFATKNTQKILRSAVKRQRSQRKLQLLLCGITRLVVKWLPDEMVRERDWIGLTERFLDGELSDEYVREYRRLPVTAEVDALRWITPEWRATFVLQCAIGYDQKLETVEQAIEMGGLIHDDLAHEGYSLERYRLQVCDIIRELYAPPDLQYRHQPNFTGGGILLPDGSTFHIPENAKLIADGIQHDQAFDRLPILADALEDANLTDRPLLDHLRHGTHHRRGCWAFDIIMGRS